MQRIENAPWTGERIGVGEFGCCSSQLFGPGERSQGVIESPAGFSFGQCCKQYAGLKAIIGVTLFVRGEAAFSFDGGADECGGASAPDGLLRKRPTRATMAVTSSESSR